MKLLSLTFPFHPLSHKNVDELLKLMVRKHIYCKVHKSGDSPIKQSESPKQQPSTTFDAKKFSTFFLSVKQIQTLLLRRTNRRFFSTREELQNSLYLYKEIKSEIRGFLLQKIWIKKLKSQIGGSTSLENKCLSEVRTIIFFVFRFFLFWRLINKIINLTNLKD